MADGFFNPPRWWTFPTPLDRVYAKFPSKSKRLSLVKPTHQNDSQFTGKDLPILINGRKIRAQHDTGAEGGNFISQDLASELGLRIRNENDDRRSFSIANGKVVQAIGSVKASCAFAKEPQTKIDCWFYVFKNLASSLIMGSQFLQETKTMSVFTNRLEDCQPRSKTIPMLNLIASTQQPRRRLAAFVDGRSTYINADSGSHLDFMSLAYAEKHFYEIDRRANCRKAIQLADETITLTVGEVTAKLTLENGSSYLKTFNVLKGLTSEVLLGESTLEETKTFTALESSFVTVLVVERYFGLSVLVNLGKVTEFLANTFSRRRKLQPRPQRKLHLVRNPSTFQLIVR